MFLNSLMTDYVGRFILLERVKINRYKTNQKLVKLQRKLVIE